MFGAKEVPSHRFNAGEKVLFWVGVFVLGLLVAGSGIVLNQILPGLANTRGQMQVANIVHGVASAFMMALFVGHISSSTKFTNGFTGRRTSSTL
jgi:formate dehydrogenase subunit gamma